MKKILIIISFLLIFLTGCAGSRDAEYELTDSVEAYASSESSSDETDSESGSFESSTSEVSTSKSSGSETDTAEESSSETSESSEPKTLFVYVCGAVKNPGVYELPWGSRIYQAVDAAGGLLDTADDRCLNQAEVLTDGQQIIVYEEGEEIPEETSSETAQQTASADSGSESLTKVNINTADREKLMTLPGIGESRADEIINYRTEHGNFTAIEDIMNISGIKEKMFAKIRDYIEV